MMNSLIQKITVNRTYTSDCETDELKRWLDEKNEEGWLKGKFTVRRQYPLDYKIISKFSLGTMVFLGFGHIACVVKLNCPTGELVNIRTKLRHEHIIFAVVFGLIQLAMMFNMELKKLPLFMSLVFAMQVIFHLWFHLVYRLQENSLISQVCGTLKLRKKRR